MPTLREQLPDWTDWDLAAFRLGQALGLYETDEDWLIAKGTQWTDNAVGTALHEALLALARGGVLDSRSDPDEQFRWRPV